MEYRMKVETYSRVKPETYPQLKPETWPLIKQATCPPISIFETDYATKRNLKMQNQNKRWMKQQINIYLSNKRTNK